MRAANSRGRNPRHGERTRDDLIDSAEELFSRFGVEGTSIRAVNANAGAGPSSVHYHFGDRDGLLRAVINRRGKAVTQSLFHALDELDQRSAPPSVRDVVDVLSRPLMEVIEIDPTGGLRWIKVIAWLAQSRDPLLVRLTARPGGLNDRFERQIRRALPDVPDELLLANWQLAGSALIRLFADCDSAAARLPGPSTTSPRAYLETVVRFVVAGLESSTRPAKAAEAVPGAGRMHQGGGG